MAKYVNKIGLEMSVLYMDPGTPGGYADKSDAEREANRYDKDGKFKKQKAGFFGWLFG